MQVAATLAKPYPPNQEWENVIQWGVLKLSIMLLYYLSLDYLAKTKKKRTNGVW